MTEVWIVLVVLAVLYILKGIIIIQQAESVIVERLGKYERELEPGLNFIFPIFDEAFDAWICTHFLEN